MTARPFRDFASADAANARSFDKTTIEDAAWTALIEAMETSDPACADDPRFTLDLEQLHTQERRHLRDICATRCPILDECAAYAAAARPRGGIWAGKTYTPKSWRTK